jgi:hypothetical protein
LTGKIFFAEPKVHQSAVQSIYRFLELAQIYYHYRCIILTLRGKAIAGERALCAIARVDIVK